MMNIKNIIKKSFSLGPKKTYSLLKNRCKSRFYEYFLKKKALEGKASSPWPEVAKNLGITLTFQEFFSFLQQKNLGFIDELTLEHEDLIAKADEIANTTFDLLGSGSITFNKIPWHSDFRLQQRNSTADYAFADDSYYKDIYIIPGQTDLEKDIKLPWELSRFQHLIILGKAYQKTNEQKYSNAFVEQVIDWLDENPYLLGPNWVCPMDVGLRAVNWIVGFCYFKDAEIDNFFWQRFVCSLYDHMIYLENNWEIYDSITSNHYLSDLIGYFYLCWFFADFKGVDKKTVWCYQEIFKEFEKQVFAEGTDYESTTYYHQLVTELFYHAYLLAPELGFVLPDSFIQKLKRMFNFLDWCTPKNGSLIQVGDNDSGKVVSGISQQLIDHMKDDTTCGTKHFPEFGFSVIKNELIHLTLRHHAYQTRQPTAHFHNDAGSITLAIRGIDVFVDPGSYVYTASTFWRNYFRSIHVHNTFFIENKEPVELDERLFALNLPENKINIDDVSLLTTKHDLYATFGLRAYREVSVSDKELCIIDQWQHVDQNSNTKDLKTGWNFTLGPTIEPKKEGNSWLLMYENKEIARLITKLVFEVKEGWYSSSYGKKIPCMRLVAYANTTFDKNVIRLSI